LERAQDRLAQQAPLAATAWAFFGEELDNEIEDPEAFEAAIMRLEPKFAQYINTVVEARVAERLNSEQQELNKAWGVAGGLHNAQPKSVKVDPALRGYKEAREQLGQGTPDTDAVRRLLDARRRLTQGR
jgi:hypothetical protein